MITIFRTMLIGVFRDIHTLFWTIAFPLAVLAGLGIYFDNPAYSERLLAGVLTMNVLFGATMVTAQRSSIREAQAGRLQHATNSLARPAHYPREGTDSSANANSPRLRQVEADSRFRSPAN
ncbi:hypothetical protein ABEV00_22430 [Paenibacillus thiaminolyticus]|uniref:hypothetical protein n=1 Tax=Paenibacillus TaxID=44249 RepID=UPI001059F800|nr:hypothetical protein [Paenibacillus dendritiformis]TDL52732.1 hypothetical protein E2R60_16030 [Paenibacillus dendritiformis]